MTSAPWRGPGPPAGWRVAWPPSAPRCPAGLELVAERIELAERMEQADLVVTGEGLLDEESFHGKAVGGVVALAHELGVPVVILAGDAIGEHAVPYRTLVDTFGERGVGRHPRSAG